MANIGAFGAARAEAAAPTTPEVYDTFTFFGQEYRIANEVSGASLFTLADAVSSELDIKDMQQTAAVKALVKDCTHAEDWPKLWAHYSAQRGDLEELVGAFSELSIVLYQHVAGRPTVRPSESPSGPLTTGNDSSGPSSTPLTTPTSPEEVQRMRDALAAIEAGGSTGSQAA